MSEMNINGIDLNLLPPLSALLKHRHISKAAVDAGMSQPAMSRALARLRHLLGDPLLVRGEQGLVLTPRAKALQQQVEATLMGAKALFVIDSFDPSKVQRRIRIAGLDVHATLILPKLLKLLSKEAPGIQVQIVPYSPDIKASMDAGDISFAFALSSTALPPGARTMPLQGDNLALVMRKKHPGAARSWTLKDYAREGHVVISIRGDGSSEVDAQLAAAGLQRRITATVPSFSSALAVVAETDLITTISENFARKFEKHFQLVIKKTPLPQRQLDLTLVWSGIHDQDATLAWLRGKIAAVTAEAFGKRI